MAYGAALFLGRLGPVLKKMFHKNVWDLLFLVFFATPRHFFAISADFSIFLKFKIMLAMEKPAAFLCVCLFR